MAGLSDVLTAIQNGVTALNNLGAQARGSFNNISSQLTSLQNNSRTKLTGTTTFYVSTSGVDTNSGTVSSSPWKTINHALAIIAQNYDLAGNSVIVQLSSGTYIESVNLTQVVGKTALAQATAIIQGSSANPSSFSIAPGAGNCSVAVDISGGWTWKGVRFTTPSGAGIFVDYNACTFFDGCVFDTCTNHIQSANGGFAEAINSNYTIVGGAAGAHINMSDGGRFIAQSVQCIISSSIAVGFFAFANTQGNIDAQFMTFSGSSLVTGTRYSVAGNGVINTAGGGANFFPGTVAGSSATGGQYL